MIAVIPTFGEMADNVREALSAGFRNEKHRAQWKSTLEAMPRRCGQAGGHNRHRRRAGGSKAYMDHEG
jgi:hypothetical protein